MGALAESGVAVEQFNLTATDIGKLAIALVDAATIVIGTPTVLGGPHPNVAYAAYLVSALRPKARFATVIGSYGWGGKSGRAAGGDSIPPPRSRCWSPSSARGYRGRLSSRPWRAWLIPSRRSTRSTASLESGSANNEREEPMESLLTDDQKRLRDEVRAFVRDDVPRQLLLDMDAEQGVLSARVPGGRRATPPPGAALPRGVRRPRPGWVDEIVALEEVGVLSTSLPCLYSLVSIVGEALNVFGTPEQKERWLRPALEGKLTVAEALTEPRGGSDFFGATTTARRDGDDWVLNGQKRFIVGAEGADFFLVYARTQRGRALARVDQLLHRRARPGRRGPARLRAHGHARRRHRPRLLPRRPRACREPHRPGARRRRRSSTR